MISYFLFLFPLVCFTVGTIFLIWLGSYDSDRCWLYVGAGGLLTVAYQTIIALSLPNLYIAFYSILPLLVALAGIALQKIRHSFV